MWKIGRNGDDDDDDDDIKMCRDGISRRIKFLWWQKTSSANIVRKRFI